MRIYWIPVRFQPKEPGAYLVTTAKNAVMIDRWDGESWARCIPRVGIHGSYGRYPMHLAWMPLPKPARKEELE